MLGRRLWASAEAKAAGYGGIAAVAQVTGLAPSTVSGVLFFKPQAYLADVIRRIVNGHPQSRLDELLPWAYPTTPALKVAA